MNMGLSLHQELAQRLVMTPELRQAITILQFSAQDLLHFLENEFQSNPVVEWDERQIERPSDKWDWSEIAKLQRVKPGERVRPMTDDNRNWLEQQYRVGISLADHLLEQLRHTKCDEQTRKIASTIIYSLDENGYLNICIEDIARLCRTRIEAVEQAIDLVQSFEPIGICARSLQECLLLQLYHQKGLDTEMVDAIETCIKDHLQDVAEAKWSRIGKKMGIRPQEAQQLADRIKQLDPKPGRWYSDLNPVYIVPDVTVERVSDQYVVLVNDRLVPHIRINDSYRRLIDSDKHDAKEFITKKLHSALSLIKSLEQRRQTMYKVTNAIVEIQKDFFDYGISHLKPLTMRQVADRIGLHESTVSRATNDKYVQTPRGVFELKYFFSSGVSSLLGEAGSSAESIKAKIRSLIAEENPFQPLSDQKLADKLVTSGLQISRRTVTKYREELCIPSTTLRKRIK